MKQAINTTLMITLLAVGTAHGADSLFVDASGNVGVGTSTPTQILHVVSTAGVAQVLVDEQSGAAAPRELFKLQNRGNTKFSVTEMDSGHNWVFANPGIGGNPQFRISDQASPVVEMTVYRGGDVTIAGTLTENSDRTTKTGIEALEGRDVLAKVVQLPVSRWSRKSAPEVSHIGPMAQDFHALFGVGQDPKRIATIDTSGVALAAIKGLNEVILEKDAEIAKLEERLVRLERMVVGLSVSQRGLADGEAARVATHR